MSYHGNDESGYEQAVEDDRWVRGHNMTADQFDRAIDADNARRNRGES